MSGFIVIKTGSASLGTVALGTGKIMVPVRIYIMFSITVGEVVPHRGAIVRRGCMA